MAKNGSGKGRREAPTPALLPSTAQTPEGKPGVVRRERLLQTLLDNDRPVVVVAAPGGSGKTTLLREFAADCGQPVVWLTLDELIVDPADFPARFLEAARVAIPGFGSGVEIASRAKPSATLDALAGVCVGAPFVVVLDDVQHIADAADLLKSVEELMTRIPESCRIVLSGSLIPLPKIAEMSVRQQVRRLGSRDLAFTTDEVVQLYRGLGTELTLDDAQHLADVTEGWAAALILLADRVKAGRPVGSLEFLRSTDPLYEYIGVDQFDGLSDETKQFLLNSAVLLTLEATTVNELLEIKDAVATLESLAHSALPVDTVEEQPDAYRYRRVFRAFLVSQLRFTQPEQFRELNLKAATIHERSLKWEAALYHVIQAGAWDRIEEIIEKVAPRMFEEGRFDSLAEWLEGVPDEALAAQPRLLLWRARSLHYLNQMDRALALISQATELFEVRNEPLGLAEALLAKGMSLRVKGDYSEALDVLLKARSLLPEDLAATALTAELRKELGMTLSRCGALNESIQELTAVVSYYESLGDKYNIAHTIGELATSLGFAGRLAETIVYLERARSLWEELGNGYFLVQTLNNLGMSYYLQGDLPRAESIFQQGLEQAQTLDDMKWQLYLAACIADVKKDSGEYRAAIDIYTSSLDDSWVVTDAYIRVYLMDALADAYRLTGEIADAEAWVSRARAEAEQTGGDLEMGKSLMTAGLVKRGQEDLKDAADHLEEALPYLKNKGAHRELATAYFHLADIYFSLKRKKMALDMLESCAEVVKELGYDHFLVIEARRNPLLVQYASANKAADGYYNRVLKLMKSTSAVKDGTEADDGDDASAAAVRAFGFGHTRVEAGGHEITDLEWRSEKSKEIFFFFWRIGDRSAGRDRDRVWPDSPEKTTNAFHSNVPVEAALYKDVIAGDSGRYVLDPREVRLRCGGLPERTSDGGRSQGHA
jgi:LuxR family maltose regulon positive regulatory protein